MLRHKTTLFACLTILVAQAIAQSPPRLRTPFVEGWDQVPPAKLAQQANDFPTSYFLEGLGDRKQIAFTFDDGPSADTAALLDLLKKENVKATFFWQGSQIEKFPELARRAYAEGHTLANHSYNHPRLIPLAAGNQWWSQQIEKTQAVYQTILGFQPSMMRPPYGFISDQQVELLQQKRMFAILWSVDTADWYHTHKNSIDELAATQIANVIRDYIHPEAIVLMHDSGGRGRKPTIMAVAQLIPELKQQGYRFTTVDQLLNIPARLTPAKPAN
ncbi:MULTISPECIES: polysaccharide deacetylase family protein [Deefgea]|uniref:Polysaccharide deacetylase family protein n=1 Tax=Deefgea chitinilytica TaxID=570276 RepID=A0ABS2CC76_9NEIS|nr:MULTISPECIES: polysaccharide deacetylase family protein [Deefgea]MBM5571745.1 polysaccharide deacetylase family protein [Deefgea chitinilytica]MBM9888980.1 polysaccharide deacetylase family protein [Deefgea sp. CFH1-16]